MTTPVRLAPLLRADREAQFQRALPGLRQLSDNFAQLPEPELRRLYELSVEALVALTDRGDDALARAWAEARVDAARRADADLAEMDASFVRLSETLGEIVAERLQGTADEAATMETLRDGIDQLHEIYLRASEKRGNDDLGQLSGWLGRIRAEPDPGGVLAALCAAARELTGAGDATATLDGDDALAGLAGPEVLGGAGDPRRAALPAALSTSRAPVASPLVSRDGRSLGVLYLADKPDGRFHRRDLEITGVLAAHAADAVAQVRLVGDLQRTEERLRALATRMSVTHDEQRRRIAEQLHDRFQQDLAALTMRLQLLERRRGGGDDDGELAELSRLTGRLAVRARELSDEVSSPVLRVLGLSSWVQALLEWVRAEHGLETEFEASGPARQLPHELVVVLHHTVRELLDNVIHHARARRLSVRLVHRDEELQIEVEDDGVGFDPDDVDSNPGEAAGLGLFGARQQIRSAGGWLEIDSAPGQGTRIRAFVPLGAAAPRYRSQTA